MMITVKKVACAITVCFLFIGMGLQSTHYSASTIVKNQQIVPADEDSLVLENKHLILTFNTSSHSFTVINKETDTVWRSNPEKPDEDKIAKARVRQQLSTLMTVRYLDKHQLEDYAVSYTASVMKNKASAIKKDNMIFLLYKFEEEKFEIPVEIRLYDDSFDFTVLTGEIREYGENCVLGIEMLPYFGAGTKDDEGYMVIPDGSGALINFNNGKVGYASYNEKVYGRDKNLELERLMIKKQDIKLPVFGMKNGNAGWLAVIREGASAAVKAEVFGMKSSYNNVYCETELRSYDTYTMGETLGARVKLINLFQKGDINYQSITATYFFLEGTQSSYAGMARRYRQYLTDEKGLKKSGAEDHSLHLEFTGSEKVKKSFLGIPYIANKKLTGFYEAQKILEDLTNLGVDRIDVKYSHWDNSSADGKPPSKLNPLSILGGKKKLSLLLQYCESKGIKLGFEIEPAQFSKFGNGFSSLSSAKTISGIKAKLYSYNTATYFKDKSKYKYLLSPAKYMDISDKLLKSANKLEIAALSLGSLSNSVSSDFNESSWNRQKTVGEMEKSAQLLIQNGMTLMANNANDYMLPYADIIFNAPKSSSRFELCDESIPFYQIALSGYKDYSSTPINYSTESRLALLHAIETGSMLSFDITQYKGSSEKHSSSYAFWKDIIVSYYYEYKSVFNQIRGAEIQDHVTLKSGWTKTIFDNGIEILVNTTDKSFVENEITVESMDYQLVKEGMLLEK